MKDKEEIIGNQSRVKVVKNKVAPLFGLLILILCMAKAFPKWENCLTLGWTLGLLKSLAHGFHIKASRLDKAAGMPKKYLIDNTEIAAEIENKILQNAGVLDATMLDQPSGQEQAEAELDSVDDPLST